MFKRKTSKELLGFNDLWMALVGVPLVAFVVPLLFFKSTLKDGLGAYLPEYGISLTYTLSYWFATREIFMDFRCLFPGQKETAKRIIFTSLSVFVVFLIINFGLDGILHRAFNHQHRPDVTEFDYASGSFIIVALVSAIYESIFLYDRWKRALLETEQLKRENVESQLEGLKSQVNPHFLFNSLNTLTGLIPENPDRAVEFVRRLSKVYRYILEIRDKKLITLSEELAFLHAYIFLLKERFTENLHIDLRIPAEVMADRIVPLSLQILFENAINHNIISAHKPLTIEAFVERDCLFVRNNLQKKHQEMPSTQMGLQNIRNRYAFFTDKQVDVIETKDYFLVCLPLLKIPAEIEFS